MMELLPNLRDCFRTKTSSPETAGLLLQPDIDDTPVIVREILSLCQCQTPRMFHIQEGID